MATPVRRRTAPAGAAKQSTPTQAKAAPKRTRSASVESRPVIDMTQVRAIPEWIDINDVKPYRFNARDNAKAVAAVQESIKQFGFIVPIVIDDDGNLAAGHTRIEGAKNLGMAEVLALRASHLTTEQIDAFRLVDNKVSEIADWDTDLLAPELARLTQFGFDFTDFGWSQEEVDCLSSVVTADCLSLADLAPVAEQGQADDGRLGTRRGPQTTRLVLGELVVFIPSEAYRSWIDGLQRLHNFDKSEIEADVLNRLRITT